MKHSSAMVPGLSRFIFSGYMPGKAARKKRWWAEFWFISHDDTAWGCNEATLRHSITLTRSSSISFTTPMPHYGFIYATIICYFIHIYADGRRDFIYLLARYFLLSASTQPPLFYIFYMILHSTLRCHWLNSSASPFYIRAPNALLILASRSHIHCHWWLGLCLLRLMSCRPGAILKIIRCRAHFLIISKQALASKRRQISYSALLPHSHASHAPASSK